jgi:SAM-dependent methyltransferase
VRPEYPEAVYRWLSDHAALRPHTRTLEIGAGNGLATRRLIEYGANPITVVEPDARFVPLLHELRDETGVELHVIESAFEDAALPSRAFDLVAVATSFHWLDPAIALAKIADALVPGGFAALWWNVFHDVDREDPFHEATQALLADLAISPSGAPDELPFALDRRAREAEIARTGNFEAVRYFETRWTLVLDAAQTRRLYEGFSHIQRLPASGRTWLLDALEDIARTEFAGRVERNMTTPLYLARRR